MPKGKKYPADIAVKFPAGKRNKLTVAFRIFTSLPIFVVIALLASSIGEKSAFGGLVVLPTVLLICFRQKYPEWWFDWNLAFTNFAYRVGAYVCLLTDEYPATDAPQGVRIALKYPDVRKELNRWLPWFKWIFALPHAVILVFLDIAAVVATIAAWFAILFTGRHPKSLFTFVVGVLRWNLRLAAFAILLTTDEYPPFSLES